MSSSEEEIAGTVRSLALAPSAGYDLEERLYASASTVVLRARRRSDNRPVIVKKPSRPATGDDTLATLRREYEILKSLDIAEVSEAIAFEIVEGEAALVVEDAGKPIPTFARQTSEEVSDFLRDAVAVSAAVQAIHDKGVVHKDLKPQHLLRGSDGRVKVIDFGLSTRLVQEYCQWIDADSIEGTLAYLAPEQTGRLNRAVDRRSDLYSLGVTFYEMATGRLPFESRDPLELVHCHLAKTAVRVDALCPAIPSTVASIIERLMAKDAEDRYQSAAGLTSDLGRCLAEWQRLHSIEPFPLAARDVSDVLMIPQKLYGREAALALLQEGLERARQGSSQMILISGPAGIGKSALLGQLRKQMVLRGHFVRGSFEPTNRGVPYSALTAACRELVRELLAAGAEDFSARKKALVTGLDGNAGLMTELIPELELIVGRQPSMVALDPVESRNRFEQAFDAFLSAFLSEGEPLVMALDDLHWADPTSCRLIHLMLTSANGTRPILVLGSYRAEEVPENHPFLPQSRMWSESGVQIREIALSPLQREDVAALLADALSRPAPDVQALAQMLHLKTHGNPFEVGQYLSSLQRDGLLYVDKVHRRWEWDLDAIGKLDVMDDVAQVILQGLRALPGEAQRLVSAGACVGNEFSLDTIAAIADLSRPDLIAGLQASLRDEVLVPVSRGSHQDDEWHVRYRFAHDRVREGAYELLPKGERSALHLRIGRLLRAALDDKATDDQLFAVSRQMNLGADALVDASERKSLSELNLQCAEKAHSTAAAPQALAYAEQALKLLGSSPWATDYAVTCRAQFVRAESEYLRGENGRMLSVLDDIDANATSVFDKVASRNLRTIVLMRLGRLLDACANSVEALRLLGMDVPDPTDRDEIQRRIADEFATVQHELASSSLADLPEMSDPVALAQIRTLARAVPPAYQSIPHLMVLLVLKATQLMLRQGQSDFTAFFLAQYAIAHLAMTGDHRAAYGLGKLAIDLGSRRENAASLGSAYFVFAGFTGHWCESFASTVERLDVGFKRSLDSGDLLHATYCKGFAIVHRRIAGMPLQHIRALLPAASEVVDRCGDVINRQRLAIQERLLVVLAGEGESPGSLNGGGFDEQCCEAELPATYLPTLHAAQAMARFHAGQFESALAAATASKPSIGLALNVDLRFYEGLARAALARRCDCEERTRHVDGLSQCLAQFETWSALCPANHEHRRALLAASLAELQGDVRLAMAEYDRAIAAAQSAQCLQVHALACELCGEFHLRENRPKIARLYLADAICGYEAWGAAGKVEELFGRFPDLNPSGDDESGRVTLPTLKIRSSTKRKRASTAAHASGSALDFESAMRAAQAIASELASDKLLDRLLRILVEAAGAQRGVLVVPKDDDFIVEAERIISPDEVHLGLCQPLASSDVPEKLVRLAARSHETLVRGVGMDANIVAPTPGSSLALPLLHQGKLSAVLYLENRAVAQGFSSGRLSRLQFLAAQAAAALENSRLYEQVQAAKKDLEERVRERTGELLARNNDLRNVLDTVNQGLVTIDRSGRLMGDSSACAAKWFGPLTEGMSWFDVLAAADPGYAKELQAFFIRIAEGKESPATLRERIPGRLVRDGRILEIELRPVGSEDAWERMLVVVSDVTDHDRKAKLEIELRQAQKLQAIGELAAGIAHEINTPAQFVGDSIEFLAGAVAQTFELVRKYRSAIGRSGDAALVAEMKEAENTADVEYTEENAPAAFERARDGVMRIATIVRAMKEFAHPDHRQKATADLNRAIETTLTIARNEYKYVADVETKLEDLPLVFCHVGDINQVFLNLIVNAAHAISDVVGKSGDKGRIVVRTFNEGRAVRIEIADTGCGIPAEIRDRIFDPFFTTKAVGRGSGQGLAIARNIVVEKHGGSLTFESEVGKGTTFTIVLPVDADPE